MPIKKKAKITHYKVVNIEENITINDDVSEVKINEKIETRFEQTVDFLGSIFVEENKEVNTDGSQQVNVEFSCNKCEAVYKHKGGLH